ncbi:hypothetical protein K474DRAFT_1657576 [Panus rudis PR-1116 ss-1]|nr:hypothetical protein K474DRAFT_1657576 [Panus rudis PR-1116 ss-1]
MPRSRSLRSLALSPKRNTSPGPPSPTFSEATNVSAMDFGPNGPSKIITKANLKASLQAYEDLLNKCSAYRAALLAMSKATAGFADAMAACASLKGPTYEAGTRFQAASGLHHLMGNHWHLMAETLDKQFEKPLRQHFENYRTVVTERSNTYERAVREKSNLIRQTEMGQLRKKNRNLQSFREALAILQRQVEELDEMKSNHYQEILEHEEEVWDVVQGKICLVVRSTLDVFDRFTSKASDPVIEPMLQAVPDPFDAYGPPPAEDKIFTILPPLSVIANAPSSSPSPMTSSTPDLESSGSSDGGLISAHSSWTPSTGGFFTEGSAAWADSPVTPPPTSTPPRATSPSGPPRPTSPQNREITRRQSYPAPTSKPIHQPRKSESKLRSVLSVIDESSPRFNGDLQEGSSRSVSEPRIAPMYGPPPLNDRTTLASVDPGMDAWRSLDSKPSVAPETPTESETTLKDVSLRSPTPDDSSQDTTPHASRSLSPQSDDTVIPTT